MKGLFIPGITAKMFRDASLESIATLMAEGKIHDIDYQEPSENCISREGLKEHKFNIARNDYQKGWNDALDAVYENASSIQPKMGHWIDIMVGDVPAQACDQCNTFYPLAYTGGGHNYCPNCGLKMESEKE